ncbi:MAG: hypothetical protein A2X61_01145 [Ignavibacteria bacterium GWB2_35_12]|nr:MAG: hypothetical protein A2X63_13815 [Ignavibacteria bacterium GWA2_35_8]OGU39086.1 MAG: hypothetical protein A2X61_01145 [Ignavibacteria bacterium GWB2_35_12]OGU97194.1 MAG: hypothetical protein A2220_04240 [Ignavibacteria bacterium RIFOXYA2_FULL_35_10]OGV21795.1 MAG: hypothetical protein A2475_04370 [Ignavibacteria bacterium RIFOXYC2_FULL_35_21]
MKKKLLSLFVFSILIIILSSCRENNKAQKGDTIEKTPLEYNEYIIGEHNKIMVKMLDFSKAFNAGDGRRMEHTLNLLQKQIESSIAMMSKLEPYKGDDTYKEAAMELFEFYDSISGDEFEEMIEIQQKKGSQTIEDNKRMNELNRVIAEREAILDKNLSQAQRAFAEKHSAQMQKNRLQDSINKMNK